MENSYASWFEFGLRDQINLSPEIHYGRPSNVKHLIGKNALYFTFDAVLSSSHSKKKLKDGETWTVFVSGSNDAEPSPGAGLVQCRGNQRHFSLSLDIDYANALLTALATAHLKRIVLYCSELKQGNCVVLWFSADDGSVDNL